MNFLSGCYYVFVLSVMIEKLYLVSLYVSVLLFVLVLMIMKLILLLLWNICIGD